MNDTLLLQLARSYDPEAFEYHDREEWSEVARIQWGARRKLAMDAAERLLPWLAAHDDAVEAAVRADQIEKDARIARDWLSRMHRESPAQAFPDALEAAIRAQLTEGKERWVTR